VPNGAGLRFPEIAREEKCPKTWTDRLESLLRAGERSVEEITNAEEDAELILIQFAVFRVDEDVIRSQQVIAAHGQGDVVAEEILIVS
jgi:hypothetical protein